jgi:hypothetical protein
MLRFYKRPFKDTLKATKQIRFLTNKLKKKEQERQKVLVIQQAQEQAFAIKSAFFKVQGLPEKPTLILNLISLVVAIFTSVLTSIFTSAPISLPTFTPIFTTPIVLTLALAEPTPLSTPKIAAALSPATYISTKP